MLSISGYLGAQTKVQGIVREANNGPLESVSISLFRGIDTTVSKTTVTSREGRFIFTEIPAGNYHIRISTVGYETVNGANFNIAAGNKTIELNAFDLKRKNNELQSVVVVSKKPFIEQKNDRILVNVDASPANAGTSVMDVLEKSPGVSVDKDGNISLKGKQGVTIMIDNRPTYMSGAQLATYLKSLPSSAIEQLEIMSNPSAKYDAAGNSGIINLKTKKNNAGQLIS